MPARSAESQQSDSSGLRQYNRIDIPAVFVIVPPVARQWVASNIYLGIDHGDSREWKHSPTKYANTWCILADKMIASFADALLPKLPYIVPVRN